jgi:hypothetical protein
MIVMGLESELALLGVKPSTSVRDRVGRALLEAVAETQPHAPGWGSKHRSTLFLSNGGAFGLDPPRSVPELSTPECVDPFDLAGAHRAGLALVAAAAARVEEFHGHRLTPALASTFHQPRDVSLGTHENYGVPTTLDPAILVRNLVTWVVIRSILTEPGVVSSAPDSSGFALSPRAELMTRVSGPYTTHDRALFTTCRLNYSGRGWRRLHLIAAGGTASSWAIIVRHGVAALILELTLRGETLPDGLHLRHPLAALRSVSRDPEAPIETLEGTATALGLNERLHARLHAANAREPLAPWADRVLSEWEHGLAVIARGDDAETALLLESSLRRQILSAYLERAGVEWSVARTWAACLEQVRNLSPDPGASLPANAAAVRRRLGEETARAIELELKPAGFTLRDYGRFAGIVDGLLTLDIELSRTPDGLGAELDRVHAETRTNGDALLPPERWRPLLRTPPPGTRAEVRGRLIARYAQAPDLRASWAGVVAGGRVYDLPSPLMTIEPPPRG